MYKYKCIQFTCWLWVQSLGLAVKFIYSSLIEHAEVVSQGQINKYEISPSLDNSLPWIQSIYVYWFRILRKVPNTTNTWRRPDGTMAETLWLIANLRTPVWIKSIYENYILVKILYGYIHNKWFDLFQLMILKKTKKNPLISLLSMFTKLSKYW